VNKILDAVVPLKTDRHAVEQLLGTPVNEDGETQYKTDESIVNIVYSPGKCGKIPTVRDRFDVEKDIVISYQVVLHKRSELASLSVDLKDYSLDTSGDLINFVTYRKKGGGTEIVVKIQEELRFVTSVLRSPSQSERDAVTCQRSDCGSTWR
jgi:hypothetical protein